MFKDITLGTVWIGEVIDTADLLKLGRVKIKVFGKYDELDPEVIPWAIPYNQLSSGTTLIPKVGEYCNVFFENGDDNIPFYMGAAKTNDDLIVEYGEDYPKVWSIVYDKTIGEEKTLEIFYTDTQGLLIRKSDSFIQIKNEDESILISNGSTGKVIHISEDGISLGTEGESLEPAVLGDTLDKQLVAFVKAIGECKIISPAGPCSPIMASPEWAAAITSVFDTEDVDGGWKDFKSELVTLDK